jgi:hypothetical protein
VVVSGRHELQFLNLAACGMGDSGAEALAVGLRRQRKSQLRRLNVAENGITAKGARALCEALLCVGLFFFSFSKRIAKRLCWLALLWWLRWWLLFCCCSLSAGAAAVGGGRVVV